MKTILVEHTIFDANTGEEFKVFKEEDVISSLTAEELRSSMPTITARQLRLALLPRLDDVESLIEASGDRALQIEWEYATTFERLHPAIVSIGDALGMTPEEIDALWLDAANT